MDNEDNLLSEEEQIEEPQPIRNIPLIYAWGRNDDGELGVPSTKVAVVPSPSRGFNGFARQIATARSHSVILNERGQLYLAGSLLFGKIGITAQINNFKTFKFHQQMSQYVVKKVACGDYHTLALTEDGTVFSWGGTLWDKTGHKGGGISRMEKLVGQHITDIACGDFHSVAINSVGRIYSWGGGGQNKNKGQLGHSNKKDLPHPEEIKFFKDKKVTKIACGDYHTMVMTVEGSIYSFGEGNMGQLGTGGKEESSVPKKIKLNFELAIEEYFRADILEQTRVEQIALGGHHSLLLTNKGHVYACGYGSQGQLGMGQGHTDNKYEPTLVKALLGKQVVMVAAGANHSLALTSKHDVFSCGYNAKGQLGLGEEKTVTVWTHVTELSKKNVGKIYAGGDHSWAVVDEITPFIEDYQPPSPIKLSIDEATFIRHNDSLSRPEKSANSMDELLASLTPNRKLELIITEVQMSHRFIHFVVKDNCKNFRKRIEEYVAFVYENEKKAIKYHRITEDGEMHDGKGKLLLNANNRGTTIMFVSELPEDATEHLVAGPKNQIGIGEMIMMDASMLRNEQNRIPIHNMWFFKFHQMFDDMLERARFIELRPKLV